jgi:hypothetical protein
MEHELKRIADALELVIQMVKKDQEHASKSDGTKKIRRRLSEPPSWLGHDSSIRAARALVRGPGTKLQAPSSKLQASGCKLDKIKL